MSRRANFVLLLLLANALVYGLLAIPLVTSMVRPDAEVERLRERVEVLEGELRDRDSEFAAERADLRKLRYALDDGELLPSGRVNAVLSIYQEQIADLNDALSASENETIRERAYRASQPRLRIPHLNPPPKMVHGRIEAVDDDRRLLEIDLGKGDLITGNTLFVYRLTGGECTYLGIFRVLALRWDSARGKMLGSPRQGEVKVGDTVASVLPGRME